MSKFHIGYILDMSGSMSAGGKDVPGGVVNYIEKTKKESPEALFSLTVFDTSFETWVDSVPLGSVNGKELLEKYGPRGGTALYDAVGITIKKIKKEMKLGDKAFIVISTDGEENSSRVENEKTINKKIKKLQKSGDWQFIFIGTNIDAWSSARKLGIYDGNVASTSYGLGQFRAPDASVQLFRSYKSSGGLASSTAFADSGLTQTYTSDEEVFDVDNISGTIKGAKSGTTS